MTVGTLFRWNHRIHRHHGVILEPQCLVGTNAREGGGAFDHVVNIQDTWIVNVKDAAVTLHLLIDVAILKKFFLLLYALWQAHVQAKIFTNFGQKYFVTNNWIGIERAQIESIHCPGL